MGGEIKMDWSQAVITVGKQRVLLHPEMKAKYTVFPSDDPKAQISYQDFGFGNYMILTDPQDESILLDASKSNELWYMEFDGSCSSSGSGVGVILIPLHGKVIPYSFKLEFQNTNNTVEYKAFLLGLAEAKRNRVWDEIEAFDAFSIEVVPREFNSKVDSLAISAALPIPYPDFTTDTYRVELVYRPSVLDNSESWQGSETGCKEFSPDTLEEVHDGMLQLKGNKIPKGLVSLERLFDRKDGYVKKRDQETPVVQSSGEYKQINIEHTMFGILVQKGEDNEEVSISFMSIPLKKHELKYSQIEKQAYVVLKFVKQIRYYILHSHAIVFVPNFTVKVVLTQQDVGINNRESWVSKIQEFNLDIKPTKMVRGQGLCRLMAENESREVDSLPLTLFIDHQDSWFTNVAYYLTYGDCPDHLSPREKRNLRLNAAKFGVPQKIVTDNASNFSSSKLSLFCYDHGISLAHAFDYYPQGNGQAESSNKNLINIMRKLVSENFRDWHKKLHEALWADQTSPK
ncbi:uncharacterized protein LOC131876533 [Cryptomeria japonica]|uniref:uncharacterized protein LOC131876533 n=1 Tax=Cryptomeria japonica TaxID=3369 RepID=UPI0027DA7580|nr:uncharacterized protein LOC131876533 [Cryptomeria japonica]